MRTSRLTCFGFDNAAVRQSRAPSEYPIYVASSPASIIAFAPVSKLSEISFESPWLGASMRTISFLLLIVLVIDRHESLV
ncbi:unannotated protein [freshwater metagenome]|uniref:Unannotated protein n=1 Tax=freshwater metagenome TaxID=449393 RepID=A0A6J6M0A8_9ZZZZ